MRQAKDTVLHFLGTTQVIADFVSSKETSFSYRIKIPTDLSSVIFLI